MLATAHGPRRRRSLASAAPGGDPEGCTHATKQALELLLVVHRPG